MTDRRGTSRSHEPASYRRLKVVADRHVCNGLARSNLNDVTSSDQHRVFPNPTTFKTWTDELGRLWLRRGERGWSLDEKRTRRLLRSESVPLATWAAGTVEWFIDTPAKQAAADRLYAAAGQSTNIRPSEWKSTDGTHLLTLEHFC